MKNKRNHLKIYHKGVLPQATMLTKQGSKERVNLEENVQEDSKT